MCSTDRARGRSPRARRPRRRAGPCRETGRPRSARGRCRDRPQAIPGARSSTPGRSMSARSASAFAQVDAEDVVCHALLRSRCPRRAQAGPSTSAWPVSAPAPRRVRARHGLSGIVARLSVGTHHHETCANGYEWSWVGQFAHGIARGSRAMLGRRPTAPVAGGTAHIRRCPEPAPYGPPRSLIRRQTAVTAASRVDEFSLVSAAEAGDRAARRTRRDLPARDRLHRAALSRLREGRGETSCGGGARCPGALRAQ
jgi:hypothetical protein